MRKFLGILLIFCFLLVGCDGSADVKEIKISDFLTGGSMTIPLPSKNTFSNGTSIFFDRDESLEELNSIISSLSDAKYETTLVNDHIFIHKEINNKSYYYYLKKTEFNTRKYVLTPSHGSITDDKNKILKSFILPCQLFLNYEKKDTNFSFINNKEIAVSFSFEDLKSFYENVSFDVIINEDTGKINLPDVIITYKENIVIFN